MPGRVGEPSDSWRVLPPVQVAAVRSGAPGGTVTIVVVDVPDGVLVEVVDDGSDGTPVVKRNVLTTNGHGLLLVQQLAAQWGYLRDPAGTTVWFHLSSRWSPDGG